VGLYQQKTRQNQNLILAEGARGGTSLLIYHIDPVVKFQVLNLGVPTKIPTTA
jgi:hypothetical protein